MYRPVKPNLHILLSKKVQIRLYRSVLTGPPNLIMNLLPS